MIKTEMAAKLAKKVDITQAQAGDIVDAMFSTESGKGIIAVELDAGRKVTIGGFGTFATKHRAARMGRNPATGEQIQISARTYPTFKPAKGLKDRVVD